MTVKPEDIPPHVWRLMAEGDRASFQGRPLLANERIPVEDESDLHEQIRRELAQRGWIGFHGSMSHRTRRTVGEPDWIILGPMQRTYLVECKTAKGKLSAEQEGMRTWALRLGHEIHVVRSMEDFLKVIDV